MKIAYHTGAHGTEDDLLLRILLANRSKLAPLGVSVPAPSRYRRVLFDALRSLRGAPATAEMQDVLLDSILEEDHARRVVLSFDNFLSVASRALGTEGFYPFAGERPRQLANLFPDLDCEYFLTLRHPAAMLGTLLQRQSDTDYTALMAGIDPRRLSWAPMVRRFVEGAAGRKVVIWCHEDAPLIWPEVMRRLADVPGDIALAGTGQLLARLLTPEGLAMIEAETAAAPPATIGARRDLVMRALAAHGRPEEIAQPVTFPGWDQMLMEDLDDLYDDEVAEIAALPGVEFIAP